MIPFKNKNIGKFLIAILLGFIIMSIGGIYFQKKEWKRYNMVSRQTEFKGEIVKIRNNGVTFVKLNNGRELKLPSSYNYAYNDEFLGVFIRRGDYVVKNSSSDSIFIHRDDQCYYFILGKRIEE
ncbi:hypothetical protein SAMN06265379_103410 [Saccharicrinis carchari]|uniref:Uncharacterized protein n=1 Tax=Saccharicrinis carchari TaxID=1168039 RepID=A0A521CS26_SACCC|nr:hypothetical protein [Saccharicrinis carchari]SMO62185.1 hypothetical protein SAMN06265379_103410 [Saccharicrinis carchari]